MNKLKITILILAIIGSNAGAADSFGSLLEQTGWNRIIGTWVDAETRGKQNKSSFAWKYERNVLENITNLPDRETLSLFTRDLKTGGVFVASADSVGASSTGEVVFVEGVATFKIDYVTEKGEAGSVEIKYVLVDDNTLSVTYVMEQPMTIKLVREK